MRFAKAAHADEQIWNTTNYLLEGTLLSYDLIQRYKPSELLAGAILLARKFRGGRTSWSTTLEHYTGYKEEEAAKVAHDIQVEKSRRAVMKAYLSGSGRVYLNRKYRSILWGGV